MNLGENIKKYRRERDITQEELAEMLGISAQAVSHWECGRTAPDITQLPILANIFEVTTDVLLGVDVASKAKRIEEIRMEAMAHTREEALEIYRAGVAEFPDSYRLLCDYAWELYHTSTPDEFGKNGTVIAGYVDRILQNCTDSAVRNSAVDLACTVYPKIGRTDEALALAESMESAVTKLELLPRIYTGKERLDAERNKYKYYLTRSLCDISYYFREKDADGSYIFPEEDRIAALEKLIAVYKLIFEDGDYLFEAQTVEDVYQHAAHYYVTHGNVEKAIEYASESAKCCIRFDTYTEGTPHTSLLFRGMKSEGIWWDDSHNRSDWLLRYYRDDKDFAPCREDVRFKEMLALLESTAR